MHHVRVGMRVRRGKTGVIIALCTVFAEPVSAFDALQSSNVKCYFLLNVFFRHLWHRNEEDSQTQAVTTDHMGVLCSIIPKTGFPTSYTSAILLSTTQKIVFQTCYKFIIIPCFVHSVLLIQRSFSHWGVLQQNGPVAWFCVSCVHSMSPWVLNIILEQQPRIQKDCIKWTKNQDVQAITFQ